MPDMIDIPANYKICKFRVAADCIKIGPPEQFNEGFRCKQCRKYKNALYYSANRDRLLTVSKLKYEYSKSREKVSTSKSKKQNIENIDKEKSFFFL